MLEIAHTSAAIASPFVPVSAGRRGRRPEPGAARLGAARGAPGACGGSQPPGRCGGSAMARLWQRDLSCSGTRRRNMVVHGGPGPPATRAGRSRSASRSASARRAPASGGWCAARSAARPRTSRRCSRCTGRAPTATAWLVVHDAAAAEDIAQEAFIAALRALDSFDRRRPFGPVAEPDRRSTARSTGRAPGACRRCRRSRWRPAAPAEEGWSEEIVDRAALAAGRPARGGGPAPRARLHAGRDRAHARPAARHGELAAAARARPARDAARRDG